MSSQDLINILDIVINLVSGDRAIEQDSTEVRDFKVAASKLIAHLTAALPRSGAKVGAQQAINSL
jgi:hypothetical protein